MTTLEEVFHYEYSKCLEQTGGFTNLKPLRMFVHGRCCCTKEEIEETLKLIRIVEQDLLGRGLVDTPVKEYSDVEWINPNTDAGFIQWCIWSLISRK